MIFQLIYTCALHADTGSKELEKIAHDSRAENLENGITGILLYKEGSVLQVLEGEHRRVKDLYRRIKRDSRVSNSLVLIERFSLKREFAQWSMGYRNAELTDGAFDLTMDSLAKAISAQASPEVDTISRTFARVNGLA